MSDYFSVPTAAYDAGLTPEEFRIYLRLCRLAHDGETQSIEVMAKTCKMSQPQVRLTLNALRLRGMADINSIGNWGLKK